MGAVLALWLYPRLSHQGVPFTSFALFMGVAMSITAFPVLARILTDRGLTRTDVGALALACAAADDVTAWCLLALCVGVVQAEVGKAFWVGVMALVFIAVMFGVVHPSPSGGASGSTSGKGHCRNPPSCMCSPPWWRPR